MKQVEECSSLISLIPQRKRTMPRSFDHFSLTCDDLSENLETGRVTPSGEETAFHRQSVNRDKKLARRGRRAEK